MAIKLSKERARLLRLRAQGLLEDESAATVADVVRGRCALQAQDAGQAPLAIRARSRDLRAADVERERVQERSIVRTWCLRGTLHYVTTADLPWLRSLSGPLYVDRGQRRLAELGFDEDDAERAMGVLRKALSEDGPLTRGEVADRLLAAGFEFDPDGQAPVHVVRRACLVGVACEAAERDGEETYALLYDWVSLDDPPDREDALAELARRYVAAHEPATVDDLYRWSGLYKRDVRSAWEAIEDELTEVDVDGERAWTISDPDRVEPVDVPNVRLLPMYDGYLLGHEDRSLVLPGAYADRVHPGGGVIRATLVVDGQAAGTWTLDRSRSTATVIVDPFESLDRTVEAELEDEVEDVGRFLDVDVRMDVRQ